MDATGTSNWIGRNATGGNSLGRARAFEPVWLLRLAVALGMVLLALAGVVLVGRRLSGALVSAPSAVTLGFVGVLLAAAGLAFRRMFVDAAQLPRVWLAVMLLPSVVSGLWLAPLSLPETSGWGLVLLFSPVLLAEGWSWGRFARPSTVAPAASALPVAAPAAATATVRSNQLSATSLAVDERAVDELADACCDEPSERDAATLQQQTRRRDDEAGQRIEGWLRVDFATGQRHAAAHIAICPPLDRNPACYAEPADGPDASVKITQAMSYGVRLEVKLAEPAEEPASVIVEYSILEHAADGE